MKGLFGSGTLSGNIAISSGPLRKNKNIIPKKKGKERFELYYQKIDHLYIGFTPLISKTMHKFTNAIVGFRKLFPTFIFAKRWVHSSIFLATKKLGNDNYDGILIEYGAYVKDCDDYEHEVFFINGKNGLRYTEMTLNEFKTIMIRLNEGSGNIPFLKCNVNSINFFYNLLERAIFGKEYATNPNLFSIINRIGDDHSNELYLNSYNGKNYDLIDYNCQCFVSKIIEASYATLAPYIGVFEENGKLRFINLKIDYNDFKFYFPPNIIEALEKNQILIDQRIKEGKSRIVENNIKSSRDPYNIVESFFSIGENGIKKKNEWNKTTKEEKDITIKRMNERIEKLFDIKK